MAIIKCLNPECDYFERTVPEGDCCPYCGEPLNMETPSSQNYYIPPEPEPIPVSQGNYRNAPVPTTVEPPAETIKNSLKLVHSNSGRTFTIDRYNAMNKMYLGRQEGFQGDHPIIDISDIPFADRVSRFHAYFTWDHNRNSFTIVDNKSTNGTILNGQPLIPQQSYPLHNGDCIEFGREHKVILKVEII